jgi:hypothetical protein
MRVEITPGRFRGARWPEPRMDTNCACPPFHWGEKKLGSQRYTLHVTCYYSTLHPPGSHSRPCACPHPSSTASTAGSGHRSYLEEAKSSKMIDDAQVMMLK